MEDVSGVEVSLDEVMLKIGRNLVLYQRIEQTLKKLVAMGRLSLSGRTPEEMNIRPTRNIFTQTLGQIRHTFYENHCTSEGGPRDDEYPEDFCSISFHFDFAVPENFQRDLERMVTDRNRFVHRLMPDLDSPTGRIHAADALDQEHATHQQILVQLQFYQDLVWEGLTELVSFLQTPEGLEAMMVPMFRESPVTHALMNHARRTGAGDGWVSLREAAKLIQRDSPTMIGAELERLGKRSLTELVLASGAFDLRPETTPSGNTRVFYRRNGEESGR